MKQWSMIITIILNLFKCPRVWSRRSRRLDGLLLVPDGLQQVAPQLGLGAPPEQDQLVLGESLERRPAVRVPRRAVGRGRRRRQLRVALLPRLARVAVERARLLPQFVPLGGLRRLDGVAEALVARLDPARPHRLPGRVLHLDPDLGVGVLHLGVVVGALLAQLDLELLDGEAVAAGDLVVGDVAGF